MVIRSLAICIAKNWKVIATLALFVGEQPILRNSRNALLPDHCLSGITGKGNDESQPIPMKAVSYGPIGTRWAELRTVGCHSSQLSSCETGPRAQTSIIPHRHAVPPTRTQLVR